MMMHLRGLGRAAALGLRATGQGALSTSAAPAAFAEQSATAGAGRAGWRRLLDEYAGRGTARLTTAAAQRSNKEERQQPSSAKGLHTGPVAFQQGQQPGSTFNDPDATAREAGRPTSGGPGGPSTDASSGGYTLLAAAHGGLVVTAFLAPTAIANFLFPGAALPEGFQSQALVKLLGCGVGAGAASSLALKQLTDDGRVASPTAQRLQLGLMGFSAGNIALHALYSPSMAGTGLLAGAAVMGLTFAVPYQHYVKTNGGLKLGEAVKSYFGAVPDHLRVRGMQSALYSLITPVLALSGAAYLFAPGMSLSEVFGFAKGPDTFFLWQAIGGGLMTVAPALTYSLKKLADAGRLGEGVSKTLNAGLIAAAAGHLAVLGPMVAANQGGPMLTWVAGAWATALLAGGLGIMGGGGAAAAAKAGGA